MIVIQNPIIDIDGDEVIISSKFILDGKKNLLWYRVPLKFKEFLVTERLDAFVVGLLPLALKLGVDIKVEGAVSSRLYYTLNHYLINALYLSSESKKINLHVDKRDERDFNIGNIAGTGLSCGIDSFATYYDHIDEECPYNIEYFTFFNVGSHGDFGGERARRIFYKRLEGVKKFADKVGKEIIPVDSNLSEILQIRFQKFHSFRNVSCVLLLQKLFKNYYYASAYKFNYFKFNAEDTSDSDLFNLSMISTESTNLFSSVAQFSRIDKTRLISHHSDTFKFLDVCTQPLNSQNVINCSICYKCMRTMLTLDIIGCLEKYNKVFDVKIYNDNKSQYIGELLFKVNKSPLDIELIRAIKENNFKITKKCYYYGINQFLMSQKENIKKKIIKNK